MSGVYNADAHLLTRHQDRRDVSTHKGENVLDPMGTKHLCHALATMPWALGLGLK